MDNPLLLVVIALVVGVALGVGLQWWRARADAKSAGSIVERARQEAQTVLREARMQSHEELHKARELFDQETRERRAEFADTEKRLVQREAQLERRTEAHERRMAEMLDQERDLAKREGELFKLQDDLDTMKAALQRELQRISGMTSDEAQRLLLQQVEDEARKEAAALSRAIVEEAKTGAEREAKRILTIAIERYASGHVQSSTSCQLALPSEEMKGRIIGREGRNIRAFEAVTGVNVLIDDTPQTVVLSGFDPVRREVAKLTMERLVADGRINPARIEEEAAKVNEEVQHSIRKAGDEAIFQLGLGGVAPEVVDVLGRLKFRHSFAQNVLDHSMEVARLMATIAAELNLNLDIAKRVGLFHDIGKALDHDVQGSHAVIGAQLLKRHGEGEEVWQGVACHHHEVEPLTVYGVLAGACDAISASRPGARSESMEIYLQRLEKLEAIANSFAGVEKSYALSAGREVRIIVEPAKISDTDAMSLAREIRKKIEAELQYPGQIKVTVVRETRAVEFAK